MRTEINGRQYNLVCDLDAMEQIESEMGGFRDLMTKLQSIGNMKKVFLILANNGEDALGTGKVYTTDDLKHLPVSALGIMTVAIKDAMDESMHSETINGEADDEVHDGFLADLEKEQKKT